MRQASLQMQPGLNSGFIVALGPEFLSPSAFLTVPSSSHVRIILFVFTTTTWKDNRRGK